MIKRLLHRFSHKLGWNTDTIETWWEGDKLMAVFICSVCGEISGTHEALLHRHLREIEEASDGK